MILSAAAGDQFYPEVEDNQQSNVGGGSSGEWGGVCDTSGARGCQGGFGSQSDNQGDTQ